jgi:hypothetical protein
MKNLNLPAKFAVIYIEILAVLSVLSIFWPEILTEMGKQPTKMFLVILSILEIVCVSFIVVRGYRKNQNNSNNSKTQ